MAISGLEQRYPPIVQTQAVFNPWGPLGMGPMDEQDRADQGFVLRRTRSWSDFNPHMFNGAPNMDAAPPQQPAQMMYVGMENQQPQAPMQPPMPGNLAGPMQMPMPQMPQMPAPQQMPQMPQMPQMQQQANPMSTKRNNRRNNQKGQNQNCMNNGGNNQANWNAMKGNMDSMGYPQNGADQMGNIDSIGYTQNANNMGYPNAGYPGAAGNDNMGKMMAQERRVSSASTVASQEDEQSKGLEKLGIRRASTTSTFAESRRSSQTAAADSRRASMLSVDDQEAPLPGDEESDARPTTLMIQNVPPKVTRVDFQKELAVCGFAHLYDFCHVPRSLRTGESMGFAFVNFVTPEAAASFTNLWQGSRHFGSTPPFKPLRVAVAAVQGFKANAAVAVSKKAYRIRNAKFRPHFGQ